MNLANALGLSCDARTSPQANVVITAAAGEMAALEVDRFGEQLEVMMKPMDETPRRVARHCRHHAARRRPCADRARHAGPAAVTVRLAPDGGIVLEGDCPVNDAEALQQLLLSHPAASVDWRGCEQAHTAVLQVLMVARREIRGPAQAAFLQDWIAPLLSRPAT